MIPPAVLAVSGVKKTFSGIVALDDVSLTVETGERVGLIGPNGAGKTTLFNCLLGILRPDAGQVELNGVDVTGHRVHKRAQAGMGRTFQRIELFSDTTVREHLLIAERIRNNSGAFWKDLLGRGRPSSAEVSACDAVLEMLGLGEVAEVPIESLSLGQGRLVEVGRALMTDPQILLLDEPSSGLDRSETNALAATLKTIQSERGFAILLVEHDVELVAEFTTRLYVLDFGQLIAHGPTTETLASPAVRNAYLGGVAGAADGAADVAGAADGAADPPGAETEREHGVAGAADGAADPTKADAEHGHGVAGAADGAADPPGAETGCGL